jgi:CheY-like chemotaxis protein
MTTSLKEATVKVLIVDDEEELRVILSEQLRHHGLEVLEASNGLEGLWHLKHENPDVIVLDLTMPRLGGLEALKRIHTFDPELRVIVLTGTEDPAQHQRARSLGASEVYTKPYDLEQLACTIARHDRAAAGPTLKRPLGP